MKEYINYKYKIIVLILIFVLFQIYFVNTIISFSNVEIEGTKTIENGTYTIRTAIDEKYVLDVNGASKENGANIQIYEYSSVDQKRFKINYLGDGYYSIIAVHSNKSLDVKDASKEKGANVWQYESNGTDAQKWVIKDVGNGYYSIISKCNGLYVDVENGLARNGTNIQMCNGNGLSAQKFKFEKVQQASAGNNNTNIETIVQGTKTIEKGTYTIRTAIDEKYVLDVNGASKENGANIQIYEYSSVDQKRFKINYLGDGYYSIIAVHSNKSLDVKNASKEKGANVWQYESNGTDAQKWVIKDVGNGYYSIISKCNGLYVDVENGLARNGTNIQMCNGNGLKAQKFKFEKVQQTSAENNNTNIETIVQGTKTIENGTYTIRTAIDEKYVLDVNGASKENGANIQIYEYSSVDQKRFKINYLGDGYYSIIAVHSNKSLDVKDASKEKGANVWQYESNGTDAQKWVIKDVGNGYYSIISKCNGLYVDVENGLARNGTNIQMCNGNGLKAQKFKFEKVQQTSAENNNTNIETIVQGTKTIENGRYIIKSAINEKYVLDVSQGMSENGTNVQLYENLQGARQQFDISYLGDGYYSIIAVHSNKSLDVKNASKEKGANVWQYESNGTDAQKWIIKDVENGYYSVISKCNGLYFDVENGIARDGTNIQMCNGNGLNAQKFKFERIQIQNNNSNIIGTRTIGDGIYVITSSIDEKFVLDVNGASQDNGANVQLYEYSAVAQKRFKVNYLGDGYYSIIAVHSNKSLDVKNASKEKGANVWQYESNGTDAQKWIIKDVGNGYYSIISKCNGLYVDVENGLARNSINIQMCNGNGLKAQKFKFESLSINIDESRYPGYKQKIEELLLKHPNWNIELLYTGLKYDEVIRGECAVHSRNLVPGDYTGEWICSTCGYKLYDSGWLCASTKATSYYMDPRNFLNETDIFQFLNVNTYGDATLSGIQSRVNNTYLSNYANDVNIACVNQNVNPYYIITRLIQEQGSNGTTIGKGMDGNDGYVYYNPFNIGASGNGWSQIYSNALATAKSYGWNSMEKAIEGGITFCKKNWLENYQNTLYQNKFDIDTRNGTRLYEHQYMQNLMGAYSEARLLREMYKNTDKLDSNLTFIIPIYEEINAQTSALPQNGEIPQNDTTNTAVVKTSDGSGCNVRIKPTVNSSILTAIADGTTVKVIEIGKNNNIDGYDWCKIQLVNGSQGYMPTKFLIIN